MSVTMAKWSENILRRIVMSWSLYDTELCLIRCLGIPHVYGELYFEELHGLVPVNLSRTLDVGLLLIKGGR